MKLRAMDLLAMCGRAFVMPLRHIFDNLSVSQKVMTIIVVEILSYSVITSIAVYQIHLVGTEIRQMANLYIPLLSDMESIRRQIQEERLNFKDVVFHGDRVVYDKDSEDTYLTARTRYYGASTSIIEKISASENLIWKATEGGEQTGALVQNFAPRLLARLDAIRDAHQKIAEQMKRIFSHVENGSFLMGMELVDGVGLDEKKLLDELNFLESDLQQLKTRSVEYAISVEHTSSIMTIISSILTVCIVIAVFFLVVKKNIAKPLHVLTDAIKNFNPLDDKVASEELAEVMSRGDELGMVGRSLSDLKQALSANSHALQAAKVSAERADLAKSRFLAAASHDMRQPLHAMQMYIAALRHRIQDRETLAILSDTQAVAMAASRLLNSLLDVSQLEAGVVIPQKEDFRVQDLFNRVTISFLPLSYKKNLALRTVSTSAVVHSDPALLERIIGNFLANAVTYTQTGRILLGCRQRGNDVIIQVWDSGPGIPAEQAEYIFEDFRQLHNEERDRSKGIGLGLAIVRRLGNCLGHKIEHSSKVGRGSYFGVVVQRGVRAPEPDQFNECSEVANDLTGTRVLLIEDDLAASQATALLMRSWKCEVCCARSMGAAIELVETGKCVPTIIIADYRLPDKQDGIHVIQRVQSVLKKQVPAIIVTGESDLNVIREIEKTNYVILRKPVRSAKLRRLITYYAMQDEPAYEDCAS